MAEFKDASISEEKRKALLIQNLADRPNAMSSYGRAKMSAADIKKAFDDQFNLLVEKHNALYEGMEDVLKDEGVRDQWEQDRRTAEALRAEAETKRNENENKREGRLKDLEDRADALEPRADALEDRADTVEGRLGAQNDANSIEDVIQRVANLENLLDDPNNQDTLNESYRGVRERVKQNENDISKNAEQIGYINTYLDRDPSDSDPSDSANIFLDVYPVGSIYMSVNPTDPAYLFGGSWVALTDRFLVGAGGSYGVTTEGGEARHTLTLEEMPLHSHIQQATSNYADWARKQVQAVGYEKGSYHDEPTVATNGTYYGKDAVKANTVYTQQNGGGQPHNNIPPYYAVYMWRREA